MLKAENLYFSYKNPVIEDVSLTIEQGSLGVLIGPNGSGKSTLMKMLAKLLIPNKGKIFLANQLLKNISQRQLAQQIGYVAQETKIEFPLSAFEFVLQGRFAYGQGFGFEQDKDLQLAHKIMQLTATDSFVERRINALSGGERQRVFLARALAQEPKLLLLDEPTANLDISHQVATFKLLRELTRQQNLTVLLITHELNLAAEFADKILLLKKGRVFSQGSPKQVLVQSVLESVFETHLLIDNNPKSGAPRVTIVGQNC
ncbi:MAG: iron complex transport system ATP-binding protein [bacterium]|nr:MAG: iron complex transport system ATP-binding protein [bacterium]